MKYAVQDLEGVKALVWRKEDYEQTDDLEKISAWVMEFVGIPLDALRTCLVTEFFGDGGDAIITFINTEAVQWHRC